MSIFYKNGFSEKDFFSQYQWERYRELLQKNAFLHLLHAEEDEGKTEEPTEARKRKAREEGKVFSTPELGQALLILAIVGSLWIFSGYFYNSFSNYLAEVMLNSQKIAFDLDATPRILSRAAMLFSLWFAPIAAIGFVVAMLSTFVQTKFFISFKLLRFDPKKITPSFKNFLEKTIFSRTQLINSVKIFIKLTAFIFITASFFFFFFDDFLSLFGSNIEDALTKSGMLLFQLLMIFGAFLFFLAIPDWIVNRLEYLRKLRMTHEEVKRETKELEGDPLIKQRQRERYRQLMNKDVEKNVKDSDVVITNPTHFACALKYDVDSMDAPMLQAKGVDFMALRIRKIAEENDIPLVENKPLARTLYEKVNVGDFIPRELFTVIAEILSKLEKFR